MPGPDDNGPRERRLSPAAAYILAVLAVAVAAGVRMGLPAVLGNTPFLAFYPAVVVAAALGGLWPGLVATALATASYGVWFDPDPGVLGQMDPVDVARMGVFVTGGVGVSLLAYWQRQARQQERRKDRELLLSEQRFRTTIEGIRDHAIFTLDPQGRVSSWNAGAQRLKGYAAAEVLGQPVSRFYTPEDVAAGEPQKALRRAVEHGQDAAESWRVRKDGSRFWATVVFTALRDDAGLLTGFLEVSRDISERRAAEQALRHRERQFRELADAMPQIVWAAGPEGQLDYFNRRWLELTGAETATWPAVLHPEDRQHFLDAWHAAVRTGAPYQVESRFQFSSSREPRWHLTRALPARDESGAITRWYGTSTDIQDLKRAEQELSALKNSAERAKAAAENANRAKDQFLAVLSHELRTPLTPVLTAVAMLQQRPPGSAPRADTLELIRRNVELEAQLIDDLLDVTRIAHGKVELDRRPVALDTVLEHAVEVCRPDLQARQLRFTMDLGPGAPYPLRADATRLQQVFWNLLKNAIKFTPTGGCVGVRCRPGPPGQVTVEVHDSGVGMTPEALPRVFNAFEQAHRSVTRQFGGLGLGLTISKALVELHGGRISAHSQGPGQGACFRVHLPLRTAAGAQPAEDVEAPSRLPAPPLHILLVEDHGDSAVIMEDLLTHEGHGVEVAGDMAQALALAGQHRFDLLLSDLGLPDGSGWDLLRELRARGCEFPAIALSGYGQEEDIRRSRAAGFASHLTKPPSPERLLERIDRVVAEARAHGGTPTGAPTH